MQHRSAAISRSYTSHALRSLCGSGHGGDHPALNVKQDAEDYCEANPHIKLLYAEQTGQHKDPGPTLAHMASLRVTVDEIRKLVRPPEDPVEVKEGYQMKPRRLVRRNRIL